MAQKKKAKKKTAKKAAPSKSSARSKSAAPAEPVVPIRRELGGVLFFFLAVFVGISYFMNEGSAEGAFIQFISDFVSGLTGYGYWLTAPIFLLISLILFFHRGKPVTLRIICALLIPILTAAIISFLSKEELAVTENIKTLSETLFDKGLETQSAGVLGGLLAVGLESAFSKIGALVVLIVLLVFCVIFAFSGSFRSTATKVKNQIQADYDPAMYQSSFAPVSPVSGDIPFGQQPKRIERISRDSSVYDIPLGDEDDAMSLYPGVSDTKVIVTPTPKRGRKSKSAPTPVETATEGVMPMTPEEAARFAGIDLNAFDEAKEAADSEKKGRQRSTSVKPTPKAVTVSAGFSDPPKIQRISRDEVTAEAQAVAEQIDAQEDKPDYVFPPVSLLRSGVAAAGDARDEILLNKERLEGAIHSFGIGARIVGVTRGPTVTRYDLELDQGVKLSRLTNLAGDLALALGVVNVRIAPIPEKISTVGIEVPNKIVSTVCLRDIIDTPKFAAAKSKLSFALGKDISGEAIIGNIAKLPHMLIAGTTGSGKSVCMNSLILSILYKAKPDEVKLIMIDPKMVELGVYNGIPHLYVPVVTDPKKSAGALQWSVVEMLKRYRLFSEIGVRDLESYNRHCETSGEQKLPQVVIVIDELADLMMIASKDVEESICRVAQMGRAAGMHLIIATQRPSADVITGLMKANIPSRIAFAVSSALESRIILDQSGAEKLIGMGDMLFSPVGVGKPIRIQGAFVSDEEREDVIQFIKEGSAEAQQNSEIEEYMNKAAEDKNASDAGAAGKDEKLASGYDEMLPQAAEVVLETKSCSVSMLQRRLKLGYSRAARIVDQLEELGIVGPYEGAKPRSVAVDREGWNEIQRQLGLIEDSDLALAAEMSQTDAQADFELD